MTTYQEWLAGLGPEELTELLRLRSEVALDPPPRTFDALGHLLHEPRSVAAALRTVDRGALAVLAALPEHHTRDGLGRRFDEGDTNSAADIDRALGALVDRGLAWPSGNLVRTAPVHGRDMTIDAVPRLASPPLRPERVVGPTSQQLAVARYCEAADAVLAAVDAGSVPVLKSGGIGTRVVRSVAKAVKEEESVVELALTLGEAARVITARAPLACGTTELPHWQKSGRASKWARSAALWWCAGASPTNRSPLGGKPTPVLGRVLDQPSTTRLRHRMIAAVPAVGFASVDDAVRYFAWVMPDLVDEALPGDVAAVWREATILGILVDGSPTALSEELGRLGGVDVDTVVRELEPAAAHIVEHARCTVHLLPDLTAVVSGPVSEQVSTLLTSSADIEAKDAASTWRFTPTSVRRFLNAGGSADQLVEELTRTAATEVPQALRYLIDDCARRHGRAEVLTASSVIVSDDEALIRELGALASVNATIVAPTVLVSTLPVERALAVMREAGHAPVQRGAQVSVARANTGRSAHRAVVIERGGFDPAALANALTTGTPVDVDLPGVMRRLGSRTRLPGRDLEALARAVSYGEVVAVDLVDRKSGIVTDELHDAVLDTEVVHAWSKRTDARRTIALTSIRMVRAVQA